VDFCDTVVTKRGSGAQVATVTLVDGWSGKVKGSNTFRVIEEVRVGTILRGSEAGCLSHRR
jgi:hypothetical protein